MPDSLKVLVVEDSEDDTLLVIRKIRQGGFDPKYKRVDNSRSLVRALKEKSWDIVISDYSMPEFNGIDALKLVRERNENIPFILISGAIGEEIAVTAMKSGAQDYIMKDNLTRLVPAVKRELKEARIRIEKKQAEDALFFIARRGWTREKKGFFHSLAVFLGESLGMEYVFIDEVLSGGKRVRTLGFYAMGEIVPDIEYDLKFTPCETVLRKGYHCYLSDLKQLFHKNRMFVDMEAECYAGIPLWDSGGTAIGLLAVVGKKPLENPQLVESVLQIVGVRAAHEIERTRDEEEIIKYQEHLEELVKERTTELQKEIEERKQVEAALRESEVLLRATLESTADGILVVNETGRIIDSNNRFAEMWHIPEELVATRDDDKLLQYVLDQLEEPDKFLKKVQELYKSDKESFDTLRFRDARIFERFSSPLIREGKATGRVWSFLNVTERKKAEIALNEQKETLNTIFNNAAIIMILVNEDERVENINYTGIKSVGRKKEDLFGLLVGEVFQCINAYTDKGCCKSDDCMKCPVCNTVQETFKTKRNLYKVEVELKILDNDTLYKRYFLISTTYLKFQDEEKVLVSLDDISDRKQAEEAIKENEIQFKVIMDSMQMGVMLVDPETQHIFHVNEYVSKIVGIPREKIFGKICHSFVYPSEEGKCPVSDPDRKSEVSEEILLTKDGREIPIQKSIVPIRLGSIKFLLVSFTDISGLKKAEEELKKRTEELEMFNKAMVDREIKIIEMKEEVNRLCKEFGRKQKYPPVWKDK
ncbi:MAG: PAS domain S-box protein [Candidatus Aminicenantes bacterium]|nr:PAS domain S-box protein [Candidatus Aminicenantes bacterium]